MPRLLQYVVEAPRLCSYLPARFASLEHRVLLDVGPEDLDLLLERGWRHFGPDYFRPACEGCDACVPTRILAHEFAPSRSQKRARKNRRGLRVEVGAPVVDDERLALYHAWHAEREETREWASGALDEEDYLMQFAFPSPCAREVAYYDDEAGGRLVGLGICDESARAWSAIYFFYSPDYAHLSLGVANVVTLAEIAVARGKPYMYLGYRVSACPSLKYKETFHPQEILIGRPADDEAPQWVLHP